MNKKTILKSLKELAISRAEKRTITDVRIGLSYTAALLDNNSAGVAMTFHDQIPPGCLSLKNPFAGKSASEIIYKADSSDLLERTVAIATINAVINRHNKDLVGGDILKILNFTKEDIVGMVGYFGPLIPKIKGRVKKLLVFEKSTTKAKGLYPEEEAYKMLPSCTIAIITSTSLINLTFEKIAEAAQNCRDIVLVGASTPLASEIFNRVGINLLSGIIVRDPQQILRVVSESGGMKSFSGFVDKVNVICGKHSFA